MGVTGSLLVFSEEIDEAINPHLLKVETQEIKADFQSIEVAVKKAFPADKIYRIKMPRESEDVYEFWMNANGDLRVYVNPYTGAILGSRYFPQSWRGRLFLLHTQLLSGETGKTIIGTAAFFFLVLGVSGIFIWWRGRRNIKRGLKIHLRSGLRRANYDAHNAVGFFAFLFLSISAFTGIHLIFNAPFEKTVNWITNTSNRPAAPTSKLTEGLPSLPLKTILEKSEKILENAETTWLYPPLNATAAYMVRKKLPSEYHPNGKSFIYFDQYTGEVLRLENAEEVPFTTRAINNLYPLHIGIIGGIATRFLQVFIGFTPAFLFLTGFLMWRNRSKKKNK
ncbi:MAG: PepSY domain-containing protein [Acidobacteriota bacterium]|nr:PepSY domain-containing protein [Acidobacteriota bacterium]